MSHIGHYELISDLGSGAMGKVYRARDTRLDREVALKVLWPQLAELPAAVARFEREARAVARLRHPNVVAVFDVGAADGYHYLAMECVAGPSLRELLKQPLPIVKALHYFKQILSGLGVAHEQGVIHRDLKPGNILIEAATDTVKLADFGLARIVEEEASLTQSGEMLGTIEYMAPELGRGEGASRQSDLYAAGVVLYRLLAGRFPFQGATPVAILKAHKCGTYPLVTTMVKGLPPQADAVIARLLACEPANRYADCQAVFADLERWEKGEAIPLEFAATYEPIDHELERHRVPGWKRIWTRVATWYRYQWLEAFDRTELTAIRIRDEVQTAETELGKARRRLEEATLLRNRVRSRADEARAAMQASEQAAEQAYAAADEPLMRQHLAAKLEAKERAGELEKEVGASEQVVTLARQEYESKATMIAELRHRADLLIARRRRAKLEMSVLGVLPTGGRRWGERFLAAVKLAGPIVVIAAGLWWLTARAPRVEAPATSPSLPVRDEPGTENKQTEVSRQPMVSSRSFTVPSIMAKPPSNEDTFALIREELHRNLVLYRRFNGAFSADKIWFSNPGYARGRSGLTMIIPDGGRCDFRLPGTILKAGTILAMVAVRSSARPATFWQLDLGYPYAGYHPGRGESVRMNFRADGEKDPPDWAAEGGENYWEKIAGRRNTPENIIAQSWGPEGFKCYNIITRRYQNTNQRSGIPFDRQQAGIVQQERYLYVGNDSERQGGSISIEFIAVYDRQLSDNEITWGYHFVDFLEPKEPEIRNEQPLRAGRPVSGATTNAGNR